MAKQEKRKPRVRFPDELVFLDNIKGNDIQACHSMLRRASVQLDINGLDSNGLTPLHNAVLEGNLAAVKLLLHHGADVNKQDADTWTPLHAACANGEADIARYLLYKGANRNILTDAKERPLDLCSPRNFEIISVMLESDKARLSRILNMPDDDFPHDDDDDDDGKHKNDSETDEEKSSDSTDGRPKRQATREDIKNANTKSGSSLLKGKSNLNTVMEDGSSPIPAIKPDRKSPKFGKSSAS